MTEAIPRDVLAERIAGWVDGQEYGYADRLLDDLDRAGLGVFPKRTEHYGEDEGAALLLSIYFPDESPENDPDEVADLIVEALNKDRPKERHAVVHLIPGPQWVTARTITILKRARELEADDK